MTSLDSLANGQGPELQELLRLAGEEAERLGHHFVGTGHIALAAIQRSPEDFPNLAEARSRLERNLGRGTAEASDPLQTTPRLARFAEQCRQTSGTDDPGASDVLATIRRLDPAVARTVLGD
jgi:hypothetical protein